MCLYLLILASKVKYSVFANILMTCIYEKVYLCSKEILQQRYGVLVAYLNAPKEEAFYAWYI